jgi:hypothetical protein
MVAADLHAVPCALPARAQYLVGPEGFDYVDAFAVEVPPGDGLSAEAWARVIFTPRTALERGFQAVWNVVIGLDPPRTGKRLAVFDMASPERASTVLVGDGPRYRVRLVVLASEGRLILATFARGRRGIWRQLLKGVMVGHRRVAPLLLEVAVARRSATGPRA